MRDRKIKLRKQLHDSLREKYKLGYGTDKHSQKDVHNATPFIHSNNTYKAYNRAVNGFADWCKAVGINDLKTARESIPQYMDTLKESGKSAYTMSTVMCGLAKAFDMRTTDIDYKLPQRHRADIVRSRGAAERDKHFNPISNQELITFCEATGLRRREVAAIKGTSLHQRGTICYLIVENGKGGKRREVPIIGDLKQQRAVIKMCEIAGQGKVFPKVHSCADIHHYRGNYAQNLYRMLARPIEQVPRAERYYCRGDMKGMVFDKRAMLAVSECLGHNRIDVIANNYLYGL